jgi:hypothetical protein
MKKIFILTTFTAFIFCAKFNIRPKTVAQG